MNLRIILIFFLLATVTNLNATNRFGDWEVVGTSARTGSWTNDQRIISMFEIEYIKDQNCVPAVGFLIMKGKVLGGPVGQKVADSKMQLKVGKSLWSDKTIANIHERGVEYWYYAHDSLIASIKKGREIIVYPPLASNNGVTFSLSGSSKALNQASSNCRGH